MSTELIKKIRAGECVGADLRGAVLNGARLNEADLRDAVLRDARLNRVDLRDALLNRADLNYADLNYANLRGARMKGALLNRANLRDADLRGAVLNGSDLSGADLSGAKLEGANLSGANLNYASLDGSDLRGARLPAPTMVLLAEWGECTVELTRDLMNYDASCHYDPMKFSEWGKGGPCPYLGMDKNVQRAANFSERRALWEPRDLCAPYDLMIGLFEEKGVKW